MSDFEKKAVPDEPRSIDEKKTLQNDTDSVIDSTEVDSGQVEPIADDQRADRILSNKIDLKVLPILGLLYLICFLDRTNIAKARIQGLEDGLKMPSTGYNTTLWIFYIPFVLAEVPSNMTMSLPWIKPNLWLGGQTFIFGTSISV
jgi:hypothetical protein